MFLGRAVQPGEPLWTPEDTEYAIAWQEIQDSLCTGCGHPRDEAMNRDADGAYTAHTLRCHSCAERERAADEFRDGGGDMRGLHVWTSRDK